MTPPDDLADRDVPESRPHRRRDRSGLLRFFLGPALVLAGLYALLFWFGYSTMIDPSLPDDQWWAQWARRAFVGELLEALILGIVLIAAGFWIAIRGIR